MKEWGITEFGWIGQSACPPVAKQAWSKNNVLSPPIPILQSLFFHKNERIINEKCSPNAGITNKIIFIHRWHRVPPTLWGVLNFFCPKYTRLLISNTVPCHTYFTGTVEGFNWLGINECINSEDNTHGMFLFPLYFCNSLSSITSHLFIWKV